MDSIFNRDAAKQICDSMKQKYQGSIRVKRAQLQALRKKFKVLQMEEGESVDAYIGDEQALKVTYDKRIDGREGDRAREAF